MRKKLLTAVLLCGIIAMSCGCDLNAKHNDSESDTPQSNQTISADNGSADNGSADNGSSDNGSVDNASSDNSSADNGNNSENTDSEAETERKPVLVCSENSFAAIRTDIMDADGELLFAAQDSSGAWGYINTSGEWVIQPAFADAYNFSCGYAAVYGADGKAHFIDKSGNYCLGDYDGIYNWGGFNGFNHGYARVYKGDEYQIIDTEWNVVNSGKCNNADAENILVSNSNADENAKNWYQFMGGYDKNRVKITDNGYWFINTNYDSVIAYTYSGDKIDTPILFMCDEYFGNFDSVYVEEKGVDEMYCRIYSNETGKEVLATPCGNVTKDEIILLDSCFMIEKRDSDGYSVFTYDGTETMSLTGEYSYLGNDLFLIKNNIGNYAIIDKNGTELVPYTIGREPVKFSADKGSEYILEINGRDYVVLWYPNAEVEIGEKPVYEFFDIGEQAIVEMDRIYATYIPFAFNVNGKAMLLEKDGLLMTAQGIQYLAHEPLNDIYYVTNPYPEVNSFSFGKNFDEKFCFENNIYVVNDGGMRIGHIEY